MTTQDKPAVGPLSAGDLVQHVVAKNMFRVIRRIDGEWPDVWLNMVGEPHQAHMADRWVFVGRPGPDGWIPWSGGENPVPEQRVDATLGVGSFTNCKSDVVGPFWADSGRFRLAPTAPAEDVSTKPLETNTSAGRVKETAKNEHVTAPVEAGGSEREALVSDVANLKAQFERIFARSPQDRPAYKDGGQPFGHGDLRHFIKVLGKVEAALRPQPSGETREAVAALMRAPMVAITSLDGDVREPLVCLTTEERDAILALLRPAAPGGGRVSIGRNITFSPFDLDSGNAVISPQEPDGPYWTLIAQGGEDEQNAIAAEIVRRLNAIPASEGGRG